MYLQNLAIRLHFSITIFQKKYRHQRTEVIEFTIRIAVVLLLIRSAILIENFFHLNNVLQMALGNSENHALKILVTKQQTKRRCVIISDILSVFFILLVS